MKKEKQRFSGINRILFLFLAAMIFSLQGFAQSVVSGTITTVNGEPIPGATVVVEGTTNGAAADIDGNYTLSDVRNGDVLLFSFVGMKSQQVQYTGQSQVNVQLEPDIIGLEEVVAIGYGTMKKSDLTGSVSSVNSEEINAFPTTTIAEAIQGRTSGVHVVQNSGRPGDAPQILLSRINQDNKYDEGIVTYTMMAPPTLNIYNEDGSYTNFLNAYPFSYTGYANPVMIVNERSRNSYSNNVIANLQLNYKPVKGISVKISGNVDNSDYRFDYYQSRKYIGSTGYASISTRQNLHLNSDNIINYEKKIGENHNFSATGAITYEEYNSTTLGASGSGFLSDKYETYNIAAASIINPPSSSYLKWTLLSYLGRMNYSFKNKYLLTLSFRADGSSRYSEGNKWGYFPSGAFAWRISDEEFMEDIDFISNLKLRVGYGETGSTAIDPYATLSMLSTGKTVFNNDSYTYFAPSSTFPGDLKWETTAQSDFGIDVGFWENRFNLTVDYYIKNTRDFAYTCISSVGTLVRCKN